VGYAIVYTIWLKPATPQNIVIGGGTGGGAPQPHLVRVELPARS